MLVSKTFMKNFKLVVLRYHIKVLDKLILPEFPGSTLRGGFGNAFRQITCTQKKTDCHKCLLITSCPFGYIFSTEPERNTARLKNIMDIPRPYVIRPCNNTGGEHSEGEHIDFEQVIIGKAIDFLPYFIVAFKELGEIGLGSGKGRYELKNAYITKPKNNYTEIYNIDRGAISYSEDIITLWQDIIGSQYKKPREVEINFITPLRLEVENVLLEWAPEFDELILNLVRRTNNMAYFHCDIIDELNFAEIKEKSYNIDIVDSDIKVVNWSRYSERQDKRIPLKGIIGSVVYKGEIKPFLPLLRLGEYINIGKNTTMGMGRIEITDIDI